MRKLTLAAVVKKRIREEYEKYNIRFNIFWRRTDMPSNINLGQEIEEDLCWAAFRELRNLYQKVSQITGVDSVASSMVYEAMKDFSGWPWSWEVNFDGELDNSPSGYVEMCSI